MEDQVMKCFECSAKMTSKRENYKYTESGLPNVTLRGVEVRRCPECGEREVVIPSIEKLHEAIALALVLKPFRLTGDEVRFMRKALGWSGTDFAKAAGVEKETVSRWERGHVPIGAQADRMLRLMVVTAKRVEDYSPDSLRNIDDERAAEPIGIKLRHRAGTWKDAA